MLIYDLYLENKKTKQDTGKGIPIKKIFMNDNQEITIDDKTIDEFIKIETPNRMNEFLQSNFDMPLDTLHTIHLPKKQVASNASKPYIVISGYINARKQKDGTIISDITLMLGKAKATMKIPNYEIEIESMDNSLKINKEDYFIKDTTLYETYCKHKILVKDVFSANSFEKISTHFFDFIKNKNIPFIAGKGSFSIFVLPNNEEITYKEQDKILDQNKDMFTDSFGNICTQLPKTPTSGVSFFSYDDKAFTINCKTEKEFYKTIGIGDVSFDKIILPANKKMQISGFEWYFFSLVDEDFVFKKTNLGIYREIYEAYKKLKGDTEGAKQSFNLKCMCIKTTNAKREVLIYENLSDHTLREIFKTAGSDVSQIPPSALESLIIKKGKTSIFTFYISAIKAILNQTTFAPEHLLKIYNEIIYNSRKNWLAQSNDVDTEMFFKRSEFCRKVLLTSQNNSDVMDAKQYAQSVGAMVRTYVDFRTKKELTNNSFKSVLNKSKYDFDTLSQVVKTIGRGTHLLNIDDSAYKDILTKLSSTIPKDVEPTESKNTDYAYFFYYGYFSKKGATQ